MNKMDDKIKAIIIKIVQLSKQNPEFDSELRKVFNINFVSNDTLSSPEKRIENIENYLGLDYYVDNQPSLIDFSFIQELDVRHQLISDNREMMRFRYGTRYHSICFDEFCRYAHLQAEMLLNYYYDKTNDNINSIIEHIKKYNPKATNLDSVKSLGSIQYNIKLWAFKSQFNLGYKLFAVLDYLRRVRNESSHRSPEKEIKSIIEYKKKLTDQGFPLRADGDVDYYKLEEGSPLKNVYNNVINTNSCQWYKEYKYLIWLHDESFDNVSSVLEELKNIVKDNI